MSGENLHKDCKSHFPLYLSQVIKGHQANMEIKNLKMGTGYHILLESQRWRLKTLKQFGWQSHTLGNKVMPCIRNIPII